MPKQYRLLIDVPELKASIGDIYYLDINEMYSPQREHFSSQKLPKTIVENSPQVFEEILEPENLRKKLQSIFCDDDVDEIMEIVTPHFLQKFDDAANGFDRDWFHDRLRRAIEEA